MMEYLGQRAPILTIEQETKKIYILFNCLRQGTKEKNVVDTPVKKNNIKKKDKWHHNKKDHRKFFI